MADITARFRLDISGIDAALTRVAAATLAVQGAFGAANAALAPFAGAFSAIKDSLDLGGRLSDVSAQTGIAVGDLVVLRQAFANAGVGAEGVGPAINRLQKALGGIDEDGGSTSEVFARLGLSMRQIQALSPAEQFAQVSAAIAAVPDPAERAATAMQIFGRKGGDMMALFKDASALQTAAQQVGGLAASMEANANQFDFISDAFGAAGLKGQQLAAGIAAGLAPALEQVAQALNETDLTGLGQALGSTLASVVQFGQALSGMIPQIAGVVVAFTLFRSGFDAKVLLAFKTLGPAASAAFAQVSLAARSVSFSSLATGARTSFAVVATAARGAALAIKGALISTGIGALVVGIGMAIEFAIGKINSAREASRALEQAGSETSKSINSIADSLKEVSSESDKVAVGERIQADIDAAKQAIASLPDSYPDMSEGDRGELAKEYQKRISLLEQMRRTMETIPPEVMRARQAEKDRAQALEESRRKAEELNQELGKNRENLDKKISDAAFNELGAEDKRSATLSSVGASSTSDVDAQLTALFAKKESVGLTDQEVIHTQALLEAREKLIDIEREVGRERERSAKEAEEAARKEAEAAEKRAEYERETALEIRRLRAEANGDKNEAAAVEREQRTVAETKQALSAGFSPGDASRLAQEKVAAADALALANREEQNRKALESIGLELQLAEAKAQGNHAEERRLEWLQKYHAEMERLKDILPEAEAQEMASRLANAQQASQQAGSDQNPAGALYASSTARIGAGGNFVGGLSSDPILAETRRQTNFLERIARATENRDNAEVRLSSPLKVDPIKVEYPKQFTAEIILA